ncbi:MAG: hypothetical protein GF344_18665 [Chitinivibrionales bacterium]|nr:hypothetical protein [Chitinivibrionales bacterium]MBD3358672.1 hypothetical protein [Chitinivibrionales bacterium]
MNEVVSYHLEPGFIYVSNQCAVIRTVVGSCVAVSLWDRKKCCGGMNHFLYARPGENDRPTARFGTVAVPALVKMMEKLGCRRRNITAQVYGGARQSMTTKNRAGEENALTAKKILNDLGIRIVSEDIGGLMGRKILFDTHTGQVAVLKVHTLRATDWY